MKRRLAPLAVVAAAAVGLAYQMAVENPQIVVPAVAAGLPPELVQRVQADPGAPAAGNPLGAVTVTEFFDYRCPYCRIMEPRLEALIARDKRVRLVFKEWPIFGGVSILAARIALAAQWQGRYAAVHRAFFALPRTMDEGTIRAAAAAAGVDMARLDRDMAARGAEIDATLARINGEARALGFQGTPGFVVGTLVAPGALKESALDALVNQAAGQ